MNNQLKKTAFVAVACGVVMLAAAAWLAHANYSASAQAASAVTINNTQFSPKTLTVAKGSTVTWTNKEAKPHSVTSDTNAFASKPMKENDTFSFTFEKAGTYPYHCAFHGGNGTGMSGTVIVK